MDKKKIEIIITSVGVVVLVFLFLNAFKQKEPDKRAKKPEAGKEVSVKKEASGSKPAEADKDVIVLQKQRAQLGWGRNPFFFGEAEKTYQDTGIVLKGVTLDKDGTGYAFINDRIVTEGDTIEEHEVGEIKRDRVLLRKGRDSFYLSLPKPEAIK